MHLTLPTHLLLFLATIKILPTVQFCMPSSRGVDNYYSYAEFLFGHMDTDGEDLVSFPTNRRVHRFLDPWPKIEGYQAAGLSPL